MFGEIFNTMHGGFRYEEHEKLCQSARKDAEESSLPGEAWEFYKIGTPPIGDWFGLRRLGSLHIHPDIPQAIAPQGDTSPDQHSADVLRDAHSL